MGNSHGKEARLSSRQGGHGSSADPGGSSQGAGYQGELPGRSRRASRADLSALGLGFGASSSSRQEDVPFERRETRQEREARKLEKERIARLKERERSMREEHVDGGYLVTMGVYTASEDFNKPIVRQLQIDRKIAPFWRGLDDFNERWAEHQIIAAARGLDIPPADEVPEHLIPQPGPADSPRTSNPNLNNLTVPLGPRTLSASSDKTGSNPGSTLPSPTSPTAPKSSSPLKTQRKSLAAALNLSRNGSQADITPREINLPHDPFVNGQPLEVFLYKDGIECPLCLMYYPPYLNRTRCCCQIICSECFVQIKRLDPHHPEHHGNDNGSEAPPEPDEHSGELTMEPAKCPYCTQDEFGLTYEPPPFRRGLSYASSAGGLGAMGTAMSSSSSLNSSSLSPTSATPMSLANRRRAQSLSANAPGVITTDRIRPDWSVKLAAARAQQRRRAAAADALHQAAFVMGNQESRSLFGRSGRFSRRSTMAQGADRPGSSSNAQGNEGGGDTSSGPQPGPRTSSGRAGTVREHMDAAHLENLMMAEAIRLSLADEEERSKKADKEARKEAKKREKDERKATKKRGEVYGGSGGGPSASSLSLGLGRKRGHSAASNLRMEASVAAATASSASGQGNESPTAGSGSGSISSDKGKAVDRRESGDAQTSGAGTSSLPLPTRGSHLRQISNASSISSSGVDSVHGNYTGPGLGAEDPWASGLSLGGRSEEEDNASAEPMFNFRSLAEMVGVPIDGEDEAPDGAGQKSENEGGDGAHGEHVEHAVEHSGELVGEKRERLPRLNTDEATPSMERIEGNASPPRVMVTPETPALGNDENESKQLGHISAAARTHQVTQ
ncbi:Uu.00g120220.m01.CDS01 [Anthostomella pinea]|uniref:Uu.00g120220.m01.CDS01 n=1 Tax=Anthostomella pinea TaxID=933095 RepID=A0AAI8VGP1_9PEZI|nr:Uu.00g120220.m01.CDS01 [Anthostomella pinea]